MRFFVSREESGFREKRITGTVEQQETFVEVSGFHSARTGAEIAQQAPALIIGSLREAA